MSRDKIKEVNVKYASQEALKLVRKYQTKNFLVLEINPKKTLSFPNAYFFAKASPALPFSNLFTTQCVSVPVATERQQEADNNDFFPPNEKEKTIKG